LGKVWGDQGFVRRQVVAIDDILPFPKSREDGEWIQKTRHEAGLFEVG
jgi:hypothetical protein